MTDDITPEERARFAADLAAVGVHPRARLAVAVSGGPDSLALLLLASACHPDVVASTVDHGLRSEAADEAGMVRGVCDGLGIRHATLTVVVPQQASLQDAARTARYKALHGWARDAHAAAIATAHHADDQAETFLMRAARGSGVAGLAGIRRRTEPFAPFAPIVRPLLDWRRQELAAIVRRAGLCPVEDPSNADPRYDRTRIRRILEAHGDTLPPDRIARAARWSEEADAALTWAASRELIGRLTIDARADGDDADRATLDTSDLPAEIVRRVVARAMDEMDFRWRIDLYRAPSGPDLARLIARVAAGDHATLSGIKVSPGRPWRFEPAPPHRSG